MNTIVALNGSIVYNTDESCLFQYNNNSWTSLCVDIMPNETITTLIDNNDGSFSYTNENGTITIITKSFLTENGDDTFTFDNGDGSPLTINTNTFETLTQIIKNANGTFTYTDENNIDTIIDISNLETLTYIALNADNTNIDYTDEDGVVTQLDLTALVQNLETLSTIVENTDCTFIYTDKDWTPNVINISKIASPHIFLYLRIKRIRKSLDRLALHQ